MRETNGTTDLSVRYEQVALLELLDRVLDKGVVVAGDVTISVANIDLIYMGLRVLLCSVERLNQARDSGHLARDIPL